MFVCSTFGPFLFNIISKLMVFYIWLSQNVEQTFAQINHFKLSLVGSGCGSVGRVVASDTKGPRFKSSHRQQFIYTLNICLLSTVYWKDENKEKRGRVWPIFFKKKFGFIRIGKNWDFEEYDFKTWQRSANGSFPQCRNIHIFHVLAFT